MSAIHPKADIELNLPKRSACDPERTLVYFSLDPIQFKYFPELTQDLASAINFCYI
jgi:hypothetical protein